MYAKIYNLKFVRPSDAKVASSYFAENLAKFIRPCNMQSINISLGPCGSLSITAKFESGGDLKSFEAKSKIVFKMLTFQVSTFLTKSILCGSSGQSVL